MKTDYRDISPQMFMDFFRDDEMLNQLTADDRIEIFMEVLLGSSDITKELLEQLLSDYGVGGLQVVEV